MSELIHPVTKMTPQQIRDSTGCGLHQAIRQIKMAQLYVNCVNAKTLADIRSVVADLITLDNELV